MSSVKYSFQTVGKALSDILNLTLLQIFSSWCICFTVLSSVYKKNLIFCNVLYLAIECQGFCSHCAFYFRLTEFDFSLWNFPCQKTCFYFFLGNNFFCLVFCLSWRFFFFHSWTEELIHLALFLLVHE